MQETLVQFRNHRQQWLRGMIHRPSRLYQRRGGPGVVFFHGFTGDRMESHWIFIKCARALARAGVASLRFDFYGSGESAGDFREVTLRGEIDDAHDAVEFFRWHRGIDKERLGLVGLSMGGTVAASIAHGERARALVLWSALAHTAHLQTLAASSVRPIPGNDGAMEYDAREIGASFMEDALKVDPLKSLRRFERPTLIIQPEKDTAVPLSHAQDYLEAAGGSAKELVVIPGADHTFSSLPWEHEVIDLTVKWFTKHLATH